MKNQLNLIYISFAFFLLISCGDNAKPVPITFVFDKALPEGNYPEYFKEIIMPFSTNKCEPTDYLLKPINVTRLDIKKTSVETNAWYFEKMGDNTIEFSKNWLSQYFKDSLVDTHLTLPTKKLVSKKAIDTYFKKENILTLILSEDSDEEMYNENKIYANGRAISLAIKEKICKKEYSEIVIIVNPSKLKSSQPILNEVTNTVKNQVVNNPCNQQTTSKALVLKADLLRVVNTKKSYKERDKIAKEVWAKYFDENASVKMYLNLNDKYPDEWESGDGKNYFVDRLAYKSSIIDINITRVEFHRDTNKITHITTVECHNSSVIQ